MSLLIALLLAAGLLGLARKFSNLAAQVETLERLVTRLTREVAQLQKRLDQPHVNAPEALFRGEPEPPTLAHLVQKRVETRPDVLLGSSPAQPSRLPSPAPSEAPATGAEWSEPAPSVPPAWPNLIEPEPAMASSAAPTLEPSPKSKPPLEINWEQFMGVKLFAWIGGLALFLGVAFFVKYSFDHNLIPPELRVALGFLTGLGLLVGGVAMKRREYAVTSQSLCATGVLILYAVTFACRSIYEFEWFGPVSAFLLMALITTIAFLLAVRMDAMVVAILGLVGGFLTPILLSTGQDNAVGLFTYIALLDVGLMAVAFTRRWHFLIAMGAIGTVLMQLGWAGSFFNVEKVFTALAIFLGFDLLFLFAFAAGEKLKQTNPWLSSVSVGLPFVSLGFVFFLLSYPALGARPGVIFSFALGADLCLLAIALWGHSARQAHLFAGGTVFLLLAAWTTLHLTPPLLNWALGLYLLFAVLHSGFPILLQRLRPGVAPVWWGHLFPPVALLLVMIPLLKETEISWIIWPAVLLIDSVAIGLGLLTASLLSILAMLLLTVAVTGLWILKLPAELPSMTGLLVVVGGFALFFFIISLFAEKIIRRKLAEAGAPDQWGDPATSFIFGGAGPEADVLRQIPALSAILPFLLLILASARLPLANPSPLFGLALLLITLLLGLARVSGIDLLVPVSLGCVLALEYSWHSGHFKAALAGVPVAWYVFFCAVYIVFPFLFGRAMRERVLPWAAAALSGPLHFFLIYRATVLAAPEFPCLGLLPAAFGLPMLAGLVYVERQYAAEHPSRNALLAWFGGSALFFITLIFPIQFERQWITIGWALEGMALLWLFHRVPHPGLRATGVVLLVVAFARLALNPAVLGYHPRSDTRIFNWYLYAYGLVTLCLLIGGRLLAPPRARVFQVNAPPLLYGLGAVLAFFLLNIEIADYFSEGATLTFQFSGNFARDMTYSIAWALFALGLLILGMVKRASAARYASLALLGVTLLKLFFHDLSQLAQLYRIGAFISVAIVLMLASYVYQRFLSVTAAKEQAK